MSVKKVGERPRTAKLSCDGMRRGGRSKRETRKVVDSLYYIYQYLLNRTAPVGQ